MDAHVAAEVVVARAEILDSSVSTQEVITLVSIKAASISPLRVVSVGGNSISAVPNPILFKKERYLAQAA